MRFQEVQHEIGVEGRFEIHRPIFRLIRSEIAEPKIKAASGMMRTAAITSTTGNTTIQPMDLMTMTGHLSRDRPATDAMLMSLTALLLLNAWPTIKEVRIAPQTRAIVSR